MKMSFILAILGMLLLFAYTQRDFFAIDSCLNAGGAWDENSRECRGGR